MPQKLFFFTLTIIFSSCNPLKLVKLMNGGEVQKKEFYHVVPFEMRMGELIVKAEINGRQYDFMVDTGAPNCISRQLAEELKLKPKASQQVSDSQGEKNELDFVVVDSISLNGLTFINTGAVIVDLEVSPEIACIGVDGFIGANLMRKAVWQINYKTGNFILTSSRDQLPAPTRQVLLPFVAAGSGTPLVNLEYNGVKEERVTFDMGSNGGFAGKKTVFEQMRKENAGLKTNFGVGKNAAGLYGSKSDSVFYALADVTVGDSVFRSQSVKFSSSQSKTIGNEFLKNFSVVIDWNKNEIALIPEGTPEEPSLESFGFSPKREGAKLVVGFILNGLPAERAGMQTGDQILRIGGENYAELTDALWCGILHNGLLDKAIREMEVEFLRDGKTLTVTLQREAIFR